jgi:hypothetical protein
MKRFFTTVVAVMLASVPALANDVSCMIATNSGKVNVYIFKDMTDHSNDSDFVSGAVAQIGYSNGIVTTVFEQYDKTIPLWDYGVLKNNYTVYTSQKHRDLMIIVHPVAEGQNKAEAALYNGKTRVGGGRCMEGLRPELLDN